MSLVSHVIGDADTLASSRRVNAYETRGYIRISRCTKINRQTCLMIMQPDNDRYFLYHKRELIEGVLLLDDSRLFARHILIYLNCVHIYTSTLHVVAN